MFFTILKKIKGDKKARRGDKCSQSSTQECKNPKSILSCIDSSQLTWDVLYKRLYQNNNKQSSEWQLESATHFLVPRPLSDPAMFSMLKRTALPQGLHIPSVILFVFVCVDNVCIFSCVNVDMCVLWRSEDSLGSSHLPLSHCSLLLTGPRASRGSSPPISAKECWDYRCLAFRRTVGISIQEPPRHPLPIPDQQHCYEVVWREREHHALLSRGEIAEVV